MNTLPYGIVREIAVKLEDPHALECSCVSFRDAVTDIFASHVPFRQWLSSRFSDAPTAKVPFAVLIRLPVVRKRLLLLEKYMCDAGGACDQGRHRQRVEDEIRWFVAFVSDAPSLVFVDLFAAFGLPGCVNAFLEVNRSLRGAWVDIQTAGPLALEAATIKGHMSVVRVLIEKYNVQPSMRAGTIAALHGYTDILQRTLYAVGQPPPTWIRAAITSAASAGHVHTVRALLDMIDAIWTERDGYFFEALKAASRAGHDDVVALLLPLASCPELDAVDVLNVLRDALISSAISDKLSILLRVLPVAQNHICKTWNVDAVSVNQVVGTMQFAESGPQVLRWMLGSEVLNESPTVLANAMIRMAGEGQDDLLDEMLRHIDPWKNESWCLRVFDDALMRAVTKGQETTTLKMLDVAPVRLYQIANKVLMAASCLDMVEVVRKLMAKKPRQGMKPYCVTIYGMRNALVAACSRRHMHIIELLMTYITPHKDALVAMLARGSDPGREGDAWAETIVRMFGGTKMLEEFTSSDWGRVLGSGSPFAYRCADLCSVQLDDIALRVALQVSTNRRDDAHLRTLLIRWPDLAQASVCCDAIDSAAFGNFVAGLDVLLLQVERRLMPEDRDVVIGRLCDSARTAAACGHTYVTLRIIDFIRDRMACDERFLRKALFAALTEASRESQLITITALLTPLMKMTPGASEDHNDEDASWAGPMSAAITLGRHNVVELLLSYGVPVTRDILNTAAFEGHVAVFHRLVIRVRDDDRHLGPERAFDLLRATRKWVCETMQSYLQTPDPSWQSRSHAIDSIRIIDDACNVLSTRT